MMSTKTLAKGKKRYMVTEEQYKKLDNPSLQEMKIQHPNVSAALEDKLNMRRTLVDPSLSDFDKVLIHAGKLQQYMKNVKDALTISKSGAILGNSYPMEHLHPQRAQSPPSIDSSSVNGDITTSEADGTTPTRSTRHEFVSKIPIPTPIPPTPPATPRTSRVDVGAHSSSKKSRSLSQRVRKRDFHIDNIIRSMPKGRRHISKDILQRMERIPNFSWNPTTGQVTYNKKKLQGPRIENLVDELIDGQPVFTNRSAFKAIGSALDALD